MDGFRPQLMGILNITPDSFYDKGRFFDQEKAIARGRQMWQEGADILDIGGESTRPGAPAVPEADELARVIPVLAALRREVPIALSIDTQKPRVAAAAVTAGATLINDVSGLRNPEMVELVAAAGVKVCVMHMRGTPETMQQDPYYEEGVVEHLLRWFDERVDTLYRAGIKKENIILDPGIGFGKTIEDNLKILHNLRRLKETGLPILLGLSRKSFMGKIVERPVSQLLAATLAMNTLALTAKVDIIRVHDVAEHRDAIKMLTAVGAG